MDRDRILLTPGPLTTTLRTKLAMLKDWGSWDAEFNAITAQLRSQLLDVVHGAQTHVVVPLQGSGTFSVEASVASVVPKSGHVLVLDNGAYCKRAAKLTQMMGRRASVLPFAEEEPAPDRGGRRIFRVERVDTTFHRHIEHSAARSIASGKVDEACRCAS